MLTVIGWAFVALATLIFAMGIMGMIHPPSMKDPKTGIPPKRWQMFFMAWLGPVLPGAIAFALFMTVADQTEVTPTQPTTALTEDQGIAITPEEFRKRYNQHISGVDSNWRLAELDVIPGEKSDTFRRDLDGIFIIGSVSKRTGLVREITVGLGGRDTARAARGLVVMLSAANAVTDGAEKSEISAAAMKVLQQAMAGIDDPNAGLVTTIIGNRKLSSMASKEMGLLFFISVPD